MSKPPTLRCAIYTRKSSEEGLEQEYNSLHAQRDACEAYVRSQVGEGWSALKTAYDDGGISGGTMDGPGLKQLLADIAARRIDVVVVYKVDRLTRSLWDFAKIVEVFDKHGVSFVSVTQSFNTTSSMGRLTLNMLLSFAQFEREVTSERIRDKISASKKKGMWMGGQPPLGYDATGRTLKINEAEAESVRHIYRRYLELKSVHRLVEALKVDGVRSKRSVFSTGRTRGGCEFDRGALFNMLSNPVYLGKIRHKTEIYDGLHPPIIDQETFDRVQTLLAENSAKRATGSARRTSSPLMGKLFNAAGIAMTPTFSAGRGGKRYRYYVASDLQRGKRSAGAINRLAAPPIETLVAETLGRLLPNGELELERLVVRPDALQFTLAVDGRRPSEPDLAALQGRLLLGERAWVDDDGRTCVSVSARVTIRGGRTERLDPASRPNVPIATLLQALRRAHANAELDGLAAYDRRISPLRFLAPDLQDAVLKGTHQADLSIARLVEIAQRPSWAGQRQMMSSS